MKKLMLIATIILSVLSTTTTFAGSVEVSGEISNVIVYRGQALVTRTIEAQPGEGSSELIVTGLPSKIVPESLYVQGPSGVMVLSVRYRERALKEDTRKEVKELDGQIAVVSRKLKHLERDRKHNQNVWDRYDPYWKLTMDSANKDFNRALLAFEPIEQLTGHLEEKYNQLHKEAMALEDQIEDVKKELELLNRKRKNISAGRSRTQREAVVYLTKTDNKPVSIELSYLVNGANWTPQYSLRAMPDKSMTAIEYNAVLHQSSGEAWKNTTIALSTAQPSLVASPPALEPMEISLVEIMRGAGNAGGKKKPRSMLMSQVAFEEKQDYSYIDRSSEFADLLKRRSFASNAGVNFQFELNEIAIDNQMIEFQSDREALRKMNEKIALVRRTEGISVMYKLPGKLTLPSRSDQQLLTIATVNARAEFTLLATPLLTDYVYLQGQMLNDSDTIFLPGPASMYRNGEFVGKGDMGLVTIGQKFTAGFGIDSQVQVTREFKDKNVDTLWGNRIDEHQYRIEINNYKNKPVKLRLLERLPYTENPNIEILLKDVSHELSDNSEYQRGDRKKGMLRWDLTLEPNTTGEKATIIEYGFTMKYDNDMQINPVK